MNKSVLKFTFTSDEKKSHQNRSINKKKIFFEMTAPLTSSAEMCKSQCKEI